MLDDINGRFIAGGPTDELERAGVLVRSFDGLEYPNKPWLPCPKDQPRLHMCAALSDRFPASLIWPEHTEVYKGTGEGGLVIRAQAANIRCSYHGDGFTMSKKGDPCPIYCDEPGAKLWKCAWRSNQLSKMMDANDGSHNEVVLDSVAWVEALPSTIEAVFAVAGEAQARARQIHQDYLRTYGLTEEVVPLLIYDPRGWPPFSRLV